MNSAVLAAMMLSLLLSVVGCKDSNKTIAIDAQSDAARGDGSENREVVRDSVAIDVPIDAPMLDSGADSAPPIDSAIDSAIATDVRAGCPVASTPSEKSSPCPAGAVCEYSAPLACDAGCYGGSYVRFECINNVWEVTRRTSGAPVCYCPPPSQPDRG